MNPFDFAAGHLCEVCGEAATCAVADLIEGGYQWGPDGRFWARFSGEHSTHYFCEFHERPMRVHPRGTKPEIAHV